MVGSLILVLYFLRQYSFFFVHKSTFQDFPTYFLGLDNLLLSKNAISLRARGFISFETISKLWGSRIQDQLLSSRYFLLLIISLRSNTVANSKPTSVQAAWLPLPTFDHACAARVIAKAAKPWSHYYTTAVQNWARTLTLKAIRIIFEAQQRALQHTNIR